MSWIIFGLIFLLSIVVLVGAIVWEKQASGREAGWFAIPAIAVACITAICLIVMGIREWSYAYSENECKAWGQETHREVNWQMTAYWDGNCLVNTQDGWINRGELFVDENEGVTP